MSLDGAIRNLRKRFGDDIIVKFDEVKRYRYLSSGSLVVDRCIGGGFPIGKVVELYGPEGGGKSTLALHCVREAQKNGIICGYIDAEQSLNIDFAERLGIDWNGVVFSQPSGGEEAFESVAELIPECGLIVVDSVSSLVTRAEREGESGDINMGGLARLMSQGMRKLCPLANKHDCCLLFINQIRMSIGGYGNPETTSGGLALKFHASVRVRLSKSGDKEDKIEGGHKINVSVMKNRCGPPYRKGKCVFYYDRGLDNVDALLDLCIMDGIITRAGNSYFFGERKLGVGEKSALESLSGIYEEVFSEYEKKAKKVFV